MTRMLFTRVGLLLHQLDNLDEKAQAHLPTLEINKPDQVVQIINEFTKEVVYTLRIQGKPFVPKFLPQGPTPSKWARENQGRSSQK